MKRIQFSASYPERFLHPLHLEITGASPIRRAELLMWSPTDDATTLFWCDGDEDATRAVIAAIDSLLVSNFVEAPDGTYAFLQQSDYEFSAAVLEAIASSGVIFIPPVVFHETGDVQFEAVGEAAALSAFHDDLSELATLSIERVQEFQRPDAPASLTDRQRAALDAAVSVGYYDVPRDGSIADVADVLDCSTSTAGELVRKAEAAVVRRFAETG